LLPADLGVGTGFIVATDGRESTQQDVVLYDRSVLPPALYDQEAGLFPIESVLYTIEVKSVLTREELLGAHDAAKALGCGSPTPHVSPYFTTRSRGLAGHSGAGTCLLA
jgi:hypothetical protein